MPVTPLVWGSVELQAEREERGRDATGDLESVGLLHAGRASSDGHRSRAQGDARCGISGDSHAARDVCKRRVEGDASSSGAMRRGPQVRTMHRTCPLPYAPWPFIMFHAPSPLLCVPRAPWWHMPHAWYFIPYGPSASLILIPIRPVSHASCHVSSRCPFLCTLCPCMAPLPSCSHVTCPCMPPVCVHRKCWSKLCHRFAEPSCSSCHFQLAHTSCRHLAWGMGWIVLNSNYFSCGSKFITSGINFLNGKTFMTTRVLERPPQCRHVIIPRRYYGLLLSMN